MSAPFCSELRDPLFDFQLQTVREEGKELLRLLPGPELPEAAKRYLSDYIHRTHRYTNIGSEGQVRFSLYQPVMNSEAGRRSLYMRLRRKFARERIPQAATIGVTRACQCQCSHCSADYHMASSDPDLSIEQLQHAIKESVDLGVTTIILLGGEPLLRRGLESIIEAVDRDRAQSVMFTNGELLTASRCRSLASAGLQGIFISLDSPDADTHNALRRRPGLFQKIEEGIAHAREAGIPVAISSYLTTERLHEGVFEQTMELARQWQATEVTFFDAIPVGRMSSGTDVCTFLDLPARRMIDSLTRAYRERKEYPAITPQSILTSEIGGSFCFAANTQFYLSSTGQMCPCDFTPLTIGRYPEEDIATLWKRMISTPQYRRRSKVCRMQDPDFRKNTLAKIPADARLPYPIDAL